MFFFNNYDAATAKKDIENGELPAQHLWGVWELMEQFDWVLPKRAVWALPESRVRQLLEALLPLWGDPFQEWAVLRKVRPGDVVYAADQQSAAVLGALKRLGRLREVKLIVMVHNGPRTGWTRWWMGGADYLLCLSAGIQERLAALGLATKVMPWGPSLESPIYRAARRESQTSGVAKEWDFVAAGKTNRDYGPLIAAAESRGLSGRIFDAKGVHTFKAGVRTFDDRRGTYLEVVESLSRSAQVVILLDDPERISGLTEAADAIALHLPVLVTDSALLPYSSSGIRYIPRNIDPDALAELLSERRELQTEDRECGLNMDLFAERLAELIEAL